MKKIIVTMLAMALMTTFAMAEEKMNAESKDTVNVTKNPLTGKVTTTRKSKRKVKGKKANGKDDTVIRTDESKIEHK